MSDEPEIVYLAAVIEHKDSYSVDELDGLARLSFWLEVPEVLVKGVAFQLTPASLDRLIAKLCLVRDRQEARRQAENRNLGEAP